MTFAEHKTNLALFAEDENISEIRRSLYINEAARNIYQRRLWNFLISSATLSTIADQADYEVSDGLPGDIRKIHSVFVYGTEYEYVPYMDTIGRDDLSNAYTINQAGTTLTLFDTPVGSGVNDIKIAYYRVPDPLTDDADTVAFPSHFHIAIDYLAVADYFDTEGDLNEANKWAGKAENVIADLEAEDEGQMSGKYYVALREA